MKYLSLAIVLVVVLIFGFSSISQSYAASQQAQAAIEASRAAQIASAGNLVIIATLAVLLLAAVGVIAFLLLRAKPQPKRKWMPGANASWDELPQPNPNAMLPTLLTMMMVQMMQQQQQQQDIEQFWMNEPQQDVPAIPDNTWDL